MLLFAGTGGRTEEKSMSASAALIDTLKKELKALGVTYAAVARALGMSEANVKRMFSRKDFTLKRLDQVLEFAGLELSELTRSLERRDRLVSRLTPQAEKAIVADKRLVLVALRVLHQWPAEKIIRTYAMSEAECEIGRASCRERVWVGGVGG